MSFSVRCKQAPQANCTWGVRLEGLEGGFIGIQQLAMTVKHEGVQGVVLAHHPQVCAAGLGLQDMQHRYLHLVW